MVFVICIAFIVLIALVIAVLNHYDYSRNGLHLLLLIPIAIGMWALSLFGYNRWLNYNSAKCDNWSQTTGYDAKYVNIGYGDWGCYGLINGKWLPIRQIRGEEN